MCNRIRVHSYLVFWLDFDLYHVPLFIELALDYTMTQHVLGIIDHRKQTLDSRLRGEAVFDELVSYCQRGLPQSPFVVLK